MRNPLEKWYKAMGEGFLRKSDSPRKGEPLQGLDEVITTAKSEPSEKEEITRAFIGKDKWIEELEALLREAPCPQNMSPVQRVAFREQYRNWCIKKERALKKADQRPLFALTEDGYKPFPSSWPKETRSVPPPPLPRLRIRGRKHD